MRRAAAALAVTFRRYDARGDGATGGNGVR